MASIDENIGLFLSRVTLLHLQRPEEVSRMRDNIAAGLKGSEQNHRMLFLLGHFCYIEEDYGRAAECFTKCVELDPMNGDYLKSLAAAYRHLGKHQEFETIIFDRLPNLGKPR